MLYLLWNLVSQFKAFLLHMFYCIASHGLQNTRSGPLDTRQHLEFSEQQLVNRHYSIHSSFTEKVYKRLRIAEI